MIRPSMEEARALALRHRVVPIAMEMYADVRTSIEILKSIKAKNDQFYILESVVGADNWSRYSYIGYAPTLTVSGTDGVITVRENGKETVLRANPADYLRELLTSYKSPRIDSLPPFTGGLVGYFAYDFIKYVEPSLRLHAKDDVGFADFELMLMDRVIAFDHFRQKIVLMVNVSAAHIEESYVTGVTVLKDMERMILERFTETEEKVPRCGEFEALFTEEGFCRMVENVKRHIVEGDIFQAVPSNRYSAPFEGDLLEVYRRLRTVNPSPYMVYLHFNDMEIACASPETLVSLRDGMVSSFPLAGTCPRGATEEEDHALTEALLSDEKELSEHDMLVDLARNDLGKVSRFGSVRVREHRTIKRFSHVSHIASRVTGELAGGYDPMDVLAATLPAGTLSGAPKKRACEIIDAQEGVKRGVYGGAMGYIDFTGNMDMCIGIRMAVLKDGRVHVQSGAGIVADSVPEKEYMEIRNKARAVMTALRGEGRR